MIYKRIESVLGSVYIQTLFSGSVFCISAFRRIAYQVLLQIALQVIFLTF